MSHITNQFKRMLINNALGGVSVGVAGNRYIGLGNTTASDSEFNEITTAGYERTRLRGGDVVGAASGFTSQAAASPRYLSSTSNSGSMAWGMPNHFEMNTSATTVRSWALFETQSSTIPLIWGNITEDVYDGEMLVVPANTLTITPSLQSAANDVSWGVNWWNEIKGFLLPSGWHLSTNVLEAKNDATSSGAWAALEGPSGEVTGSGDYVRQSAVLSAMQPSSDLSGGLLPISDAALPSIKLGPFTWPQANHNWGSVTAVAIYAAQDASATNGTKPLFKVQLDSPVTVTNGMTLTTDQTLTIS